MSITAIPATDDDTRSRLILTAIRLFAEHGIQGVSLRAINSESGARNASAAHYHFGSKLGLIEGILQHLDAEVGAEQRAGLEKLEASRGKPRVREILEAVFLPYATLLFQAESGWYTVRFTSRLLLEGDPELQELANRYFGPVYRRMFDLLVASCPQKHPLELKANLVFSLNTMIHGMGNLQFLLNSPAGPVNFFDPPRTIDVFLRYVESAIKAPSADVSPEFRRKIETLARRQHAHAPH